MNSDNVWSRERIRVLHRDVEGSEAGVHLANIEMSGPGYRRNLFEMKGLRAACDNAELHPPAIN